MDVHYYEDGNVRLLTDKPVSVSVGQSSGSASEIVRSIAQVERRYQEELNRAFANLSEGAFKSLRRQLPVTRRKVEWEKVGGYRVRSSDFFLIVTVVWFCWGERADGVGWLGSWGRILVGRGAGDSGEVNKDRIWGGR